MMKELLENYFGVHYGSTKSVSVESKICQGIFTFFDEKACDFCNVKDYSCDKVVLKCDSSDKKVETIRFEDFLNHYTNLKAIPSYSKCDLLMASDGKIVFCDMTCSSAKYIDPFNMKNGAPKIGKRNTARIQMENSITLLENVPEISEYIQKKPDKVALFASREKRKPVVDEDDSSVVEKMRSFKIDIDRLSGESMYADLSYGFEFVEVRYPDTYIW